MQKNCIPSIALGVFSYLYCACVHQGAIVGALNHLHLDSFFLKCVDKLKDCQDIYLQKHFCTNPSNMTHPYIETVLVLWWLVHLFSVCIP